MKNKAIRAAAVLCAVVFSGSVGYSQDITDFSGLKSAIEGEGSVTVSDLQSTIDFESTLDIDKKVSISGKAGENSASFNPKGYQQEGGPTFKDNAFNVKNGGDLTLENLNIVGFGSKTMSDNVGVSVVDVEKGGKLTIGPGVTIDENQTMSSDVWGGSIVNNGEVTIKSSGGGSGDVIFKYINRIADSRDSQYDIEMGDGSKLTISGEGGEVYLGNGIVSVSQSSDMSITHNGSKNNLVISGENGNYKGTFTSGPADEGTDGDATRTVTFDYRGKSFFGGTSTFNKGSTLKWQAKNDTAHGKIKLEDGSGLDVSKATEKRDTSKYGGSEEDIPEASLTLDGSKQDTIAADVSITVGDGGTLTLKNFKGEKSEQSLTLNKKINGTGNLKLEDDNITFVGKGENDGSDVGGLSKDLKLTTSNSELTLSDFTGDSETLSAIIKGSNTGLELTLTNYTGSISSQDSQTLTVDGEKIESLTFSGGNGDSVTGNLTVSGSGSVINSTSTNTKITGTVKVEAPSDKGDSYGLDIQKDGSFTVEGSEGLTNSGSINVAGVLNLGKGSNSGKIDIGESGDLVVDGDNYQGDGSFENTGTITSTGGEINIKSLTNKGKGTITSTGSLKAGTLTNGEESGVAADDGTPSISANEITVTGAVNNYHGTITSNGGITIGDESQKGGSLTNGGTITSGGNLTVNGTLSNNTGSIITTDGGNISVTGTVTNSGTLTSAGTLTVTDSLTNSGTITTKGGSLADVTMNGGTLANSGDLTISGKITSGEGAGSSSSITHNSGALTVNGDASGYKGTFTQTDGNTDVTAANGLFGGEKDIQGGTLTANGDNTKMYDGKVKLSNGASFEFTYSGTDGEITKELLEYGEGGSATFKGKESGSTYTLSDDITSASNGSITFDGSSVKLKGTDDEHKGTFNYKDFTLKNSTLQLADEGDNGSTLDEFTLYNFHATDSSVDLNLKMAIDEQGNYLDSDRLKFEGSSNGKLKVGKVYISGQGNTTETGNDFKTKEGKDVLTNGNGSNVTFDTDSKPTLDPDITKPGEDVVIGSNLYTYDLEVEDHTLGLKVTGYADNNTLYEVNKENNKERKFFIDDTVGDGTYHIGKSLDNGSASTSTGDFWVYGTSGKGETASENRKATLSGEIKDGTESPDPKYGSLFEIKSDDTEGKSTNLHIEDLTIKDAKSTSRGGSVVSNSDKDSKVTLDNVHITNNSSDYTGSDEGTAKGGAVYNNGGTGLRTDSNVENPGLIVVNSEFTDNTAGENGYGGAIYNDKDGWMVLQDVTVHSMEGDDAVKQGKNDIYNAGHAGIYGKNTFDSLYTNAGESLFTGTNTFSKLVNKSEGDSKGKIDFHGYNTVSEFENKGEATNKASLIFSDKSGFDNSGGSFTNSDGAVLMISEGATITGSGDGTTITNSGMLYLQGTAGDYKGNFSQDGGLTIVTGTFFGGESTIKDGILYWGTQNDLVDDAKLTVKKDEGEEGSAPQLFVAGGNDAGAKLTLKNGSEVDAVVYLADGSTINVGDTNATSDSSLTFEDGSIWDGTVNVYEKGELTVNAKTQTENSVLNATGGAVNVGDKATLYMGNGSTIAGDVATTIGDDATMYLTDSSTVTWDSNDETKGHTILNGGTLNYEKEGEGKTEGDNATLEAYTGNLNVQNRGHLTLKSESSFVEGAVKLTIDDQSSVTIEGGELQIDADDDWQTGGAITLNSGTLNYHATKNGDLTANGGNLNLLDGSILTIVDPSKVQDAVAVDIQHGSTVNVNKDAVFNIDDQTGDKWHGLVNVNGGKFTTSGIKNTDQNGAQLNQSSGSSTFDKQSDILISGGNNSKITGGDISVLNESKLSFLNGDNMELNDLAVKNDSTFGILNGKSQTVTTSKQEVADTSNYTMDLNLRNGPSDKFVSGSITGNGNINVSDFGFIGGAPVYRNVELQLFDSKNIDENVTFSATDKQIMTPIGEYGLKSLGGGKYIASLDGYNPKVFRGQVTTMAMYNNQLAIDDMLLNHVMLNSEKSNFAPGSSSMANKYAAVNPLFAPYQYTKKDGGLWYKSYVDIETLSMTQNINVHNTSYGSVVGADLPLVELSNGWDFIPTFYVAYTGARQSYSDMTMYQNGGQGGFMGTFMKDDFIGSVLAYGGGYLNEMNVAGFKDDVGNWFAGTAAKAAYNFHPAEYFTIQPTAFVSYNLFGKQSWGTDFGVMGMNSGLLNGINVGPGVNFIYARDTWSLYATFQYMFNINDRVSGHAGVDVDLPSISMRHGYFQYGIGATKTWKDRLNSYVQFVIRNGGRTGVGFQLGLQYLFDWDLPGFHKNGKKHPKTINPSKTSVAPIPEKVVVKHLSKGIK